MKSRAGTLAATFPYFGGKSLACAKVWEALGDCPNYVEPFAGSLAVLLGRPHKPSIETVNDKDGFVANFWRAVSFDAPSVAKYCDWPVNENDLYARHLWLVGKGEWLTESLHADPGFFDAKIAGWWCWGLCCWIGDGWCDGKGVYKKMPSISSTGVNRKILYLSSLGQGVFRKNVSIYAWFAALQNRLRRVLVACGDWRRVTGPSVTVHNGVTGVFLDPPYTTANMDYSAGGVGGLLAGDVREWCSENGSNPRLRIVLCGHAGEHDELLRHGWGTRKWKAIVGMARSEEAVSRSKSETIWCSPHCLPEKYLQMSIFEEVNP